jgi:hypothetical protein
VIMRTPCAPHACAAPRRTLSAYSPGDLREARGLPGRSQPAELARPECRWAMLACQTWAGNRLGGRERPPYDRRVKIKLSISLDPELGDAVREAAAEAGLTLSEWLGRGAEIKLKQDTDARILEEAAHKRRREGMRAFLDEWEAEHGAFTEEELTEAANELGMSWPPAGDAE